MSIQIDRNWIREYLQKGESKKQLIGLEAEKIGVRFPEGESVSYQGKNGFLAILGKMYEELGWKITKKNGSDIHQMKRGNALLDLESDGRIELAGSPHRSLHDVAREFRIHQHEISEISDVFGVSWLGIGYNPLSSSEKIAPISDNGGRRDQLIEYRKEKETNHRNKYSSDWSKGTAGIHVSLDYSSEEDFGKKSKVLFLLAPIIQAIFANSPFANGEYSGHINHRSFVTQKGMSEYALSRELFYSNFQYDDWINFIIDRPALFFQRGESWIRPQKKFQKFLEEGYDGIFPTEEDFHMHMKSVWTDVRMRNTIEVRVFDSLPPSLVPSVPAFIKGLMYDTKNLDYLHSMVNEWSFAEFQEMRERLSEGGLDTVFRGKKSLSLAKELLDLAEEGLKRTRVLDAYHNDESIYLEPIKEFIFLKGKSPAGWLMESWKGKWGQNFLPVFEWCKY